MIPIFLLVLLALFRPNVDLILINKNKKEKIKASKKAWKEYCDTNSISWTQQWDYYQIRQAILTKKQLSNEDNLNKKEVISTTPQITDPRTSSALLKSQNKISTVKESNISKENKQLKIAIPRKVSPLPKLKTNFKNVDNLSYQINGRTHQTGEFDSEVPNNDVNDFKEFDRTENDNKKEPKLLKIGNAVSEGKTYSFKVAGVTHYQLNQAVEYAINNNLTERYKDYTDEDFRNKKITANNPIYEVNLKDCLANIALIPEPDNPYDKDAIKVVIKINDRLFMIGYVPTDWTEHVNSTLIKVKNKWSNMVVSGHVTGGRYKFVDIDNSIKTSKKHYGFIVEVHVQER